MKNNHITIFTPTYNRGYLLSQLYQSLVEQTQINFEWLIIDDGSTDSTNAIVQEFIRENKFPIRYHYKQNEGKPSAINLGAKMAECEWFFIVDSDDYLTKDAIENINYYCNSIKDVRNVIGVVGLRGNNSGQAWMKWYHEPMQGKKSKECKYIDATAIEYRYHYKIKGDRAEVIKTKILRKYKFPLFTGEKHLGESYLWYQIARDGYQFRWFNKVIYITEYLADGITTNIKKIKYESWQGTCEEMNLYSGIYQLPFKERWKFCANYYRYGKYGGVSFVKLFKKSNTKIMSISAFLVGFMLLYRDKITKENC